MESQQIRTGDKTFMTYTYGTVIVFIQFDLKKTHSQNAVVFCLPAPHPAKTSLQTENKKRVIQNLQAATKAQLPKH